MPQSNETAAHRPRKERKKIQKDTTPDTHVQQTNLEGGEFKMGMRREVWRYEKQSDVSLGASAQRDLRQRSLPGDRSHDCWRPGYLCVLSGAGCWKRGEWEQHGR